MTISEAYRELNKSSRMALNIKRLVAKREALESCLLPAGIRYDKERVQTSPSDVLPDIVAQVVELDEQIERMATERARTIGRTSDWIDSLQDETERTVLYQRYIQGEKIIDIADEIGYSRGGMYKLHRRAVQHLAKSGTKGTTQ